jgi:hypothetical protein
MRGQEHSRSPFGGSRNPDKDRDHPGRPTAATDTAISHGHSYRRSFMTGSRRRPAISQFAKSAYRVTPRSVGVKDMMYILSGF